MRDSNRTTIILSCLGAVIIGGGVAFFTLPKPQPVPSSPSLESQENTPRDDKVNPVEIALNGETSPDVNKRQSETECLGRCYEMSQLFADSLKIDDERFETLLGQMTEFAAYLETNEAARMEMLDLALTTPDGNKRALLMDAFSLLPVTQRDILGAALIESNQWRVRTDGVNLSTIGQDITADKANQLIDTLGNDDHPHVKTTILGILKNSDSLKGDQKMLDNLSIMLGTETYANVRSEVLLTKLALENDPINVMPDTLLALGSNDPEYQYTAIIALDRIYESNQMVNGTLDPIDHRTVERQLEELLDIEITAENKAYMTRLLHEADAFYERHFQ